MKPPLPFPPFDGDELPRRQGAAPAAGDSAEGAEAALRRHRLISFRLLLPNLITTMAIVSGLTGMRLAIDGRIEKAVICLLLAAFLDGIDGRIARAMRGSSRFGEQLDSLADAINFGAAPAVIAYIYILRDMGQFGWLAALIYSVACCLRLARFNVMIDDKAGRPKWQQNYFIGVPSPAGACAVLLPVYLGSLGLPLGEPAALIFSIYTICIALLMVCNLPVWNGKSIRAGLRRDIVVPALFFAVIYLVLLFSYMWATLAVSIVLYLLFLPLSAYGYYRRGKKEAAALSSRPGNKELAPK